MIYITGDIHGDIIRFSRSFMPYESLWTKDDYLIICGDFGFIFKNDEEEKTHLDALEKKPYTILWVDGNHENFEALYKYPIESWNGGAVHRIRKNIFHLMRGQVFTIEGKKFFTFGGAYSIDRYMRTKGISYWDEELPDSNAYEEATQNLLKHGKKVDYIISHTAPREIIRKMGYYPDAHDMELTGFLEWVMYEVEYKKWFFGHFHEDKIVDEKHRALYFDIEEAAEQKISMVSEFVARKLHDIGFYDALFDFLYDLPLNKDSAEDIMSAIGHYDIIELYIAMFGRFSDFLSENEIAELKKTYNRNFSVPLSVFGIDE